MAKKRTVSIPFSTFPTEMSSLPTTHNYSVQKIKNIGPFTTLQFPTMFHTKNVALLFLHMKEWSIHSLQLPDYMAKNILAHPKLIVAQLTHKENGGQPQIEKASCPMQESGPSLTHSCATG